MHAANRMDIFLHEVLNALTLTAHRQNKVRLEFEGNTVRCLSYARVLAVLFEPLNSFTSLGYSNDVQDGFQKSQKSESRFVMLFAFIPCVRMACSYCLCFSMELHFGLQILTCILKPLAR
jgi:hypothetical protein